MFYYLAIKMHDTFHARVMTIERQHLGVSPWPHSYGIDYRAYR
jgi:hypothetical protein